MRRRIQAPELEDQPWLPDELRAYITDVLHAAHRVFRVHEVWTPRLARLLRESGERCILDLCSGGGGPVLAIAERLRRDHGLEVSICLTDLHPNRTALARINRAGLPVRYLEQPVDATDVPQHLAGLRTLFAGFHHMPPEAARAILADAFHKRRSICVFEVTCNSPGAMLSYLGLPLLTWAVTPLTRPLSWRRLLLTYGLPLVPLMVTWDGMASNLRTYSVDELRELVAALDAPDYRWEVGYLRHRLVPFRLPYLVGQAG